MPTQFLRAFLATSVLLLGLVAILNWNVDPYDQYGSHGLPPATRSSRVEKAQAIAQAAEPYSGLVLGSSRVLKIEPAELDRRSGLRFYNAGVYYGRPEDFLALVRHFYRVHDQLPRELVIGLDVDAFVASPGPDAELLRTPALACEIPECFTLSDRTQCWRELLSWHQTRSSLRLLRQRDGESAAIDESFTGSGTVDYHRRERELAQGTYDWSNSLEFDRGVYRNLLADYRGLSPRRMGAWRDLMELCREHRVTVRVFVTPLHPTLLADLRANRPFDARRREVLRLVDGTLPPSGTLVDLTEVATFAGNPAEFYDGVHPMVRNTRRMVRAIYKQTNGGTYALQ